MSYQGFNVRLSADQKDRLKSAYRNQKGITVQVSASDIGVGDKLMLTARQINHLEKAKAEGKGARITLSATQLKQSGGFLPFLIPLIGSLAAPLINKVFGSGVGKKKGSGMFLPGTTGRRSYGSGMFLPS